MWTKTTRLRYAVSAEWLAFTTRDLSAHTNSRVQASNAQIGIGNVAFLDERTTVVNYRSGRLVELYDVETGKKTGTLDALTARATLQPNLSPSGPKSM